MKASRELMLLRAMLAERLPQFITQPVLYQASGAQTGLTVSMDVYRPSGVKDEDQSGLIPELGSTGRYYRVFISDSPGWFVLITDDAGGNAIKQF